MNTEWLEMEEAFDLLTEKSKVNIYTTHQTSDTDNSADMCYYNGVTMIALFSNKADVDRNIVRFSVYAEDIVENLSPDIHCTWVEDCSNPITANFCNNGWGETGELHIFISNNDIGYYEKKDANIAQISICKGAQNDWVFDSIRPGELKTLSFASPDIFDVQWKDPTVKSISFYIRIVIYAPEIGYATSSLIPMTATPHGVQAEGVGGMGGNEDKNYVIVVDTSFGSWSQKYPIYQRIPARQTVKLPIFILPMKSCSMSLRIEFELDDGETIIAEPLYNAAIKVPYYTELQDYVSGDDLDWSSLEGSATIWFPYEMTSKVVGTSEDST